jgi:hypothetical protein
MYHDGATIGAGTAHSFGEAEFTLNLTGGYDAQSLIYCVMFC